MAHRYLYGDAGLIEELLSKWKLIESSEGDFAAVYKDPAAKAFWLRYYATAATQGGGYLTLMRLPAPATDELIDIAINSEHEDEFVAAVLRLLDEEAIEKKSFRHMLIQRLEQVMQRRDVKHDRLLKVIKLSTLDDPTNRRELLQKTLEEIQADADYFESIALRAVTLQGRLQKQTIK